MATVTAGSRLLLGTHVLRTLRDVELGDGWSIPVVADAATLGADPAVVEVPTDEGALRVGGALVGDGSSLDVRPVGRCATLPVQRRGDLRGRLALPLRGSLLPPGPLPGPPKPLAEDPTR